MRCKNSKFKCNCANRSIEMKLTTPSSFSRCGLKTQSMQLRDLSWMSFTKSHFNRSQLFNEFKNYIKLNQMLWKRKLANSSMIWVQLYPPPELNSVSLAKLLALLLLVKLSEDLFLKFLSNSRSIDFEVSLSLVGYFL